MRVTSFACTRDRACAHGCVHWGGTNRRTTGKPPNFCMARPVHCRPARGGIMMELRLAVALVLIGCTQAGSKDPVARSLDDAAAAAGVPAELMTAIAIE